MRYYDSDTPNHPAPRWMKDVLKVNPEYNGWGNFEDYMWNDNGGWQSRSQIDSPDELWELDDLNECVNFYFSVDRDSEECKACEGIGYNEATMVLYNGCYHHRSKNGGYWLDKLEQEEVDALWEAGRLRCDFKEKPTVEELNAAAERPMTHDAINTHILVQARGERLGIYGTCEVCGGQGHIHTEPDYRLALQLWIIHPRKGCSRGLYVRNVKQDELARCRAWLEVALARNNDRFSKLEELPSG